MESEIASFDATVTRLEVALEPDGDPREAEGILNPAATRSRSDRLLLFPRVVAEDNISRIALVEVGGTPEQPRYERAGYALEPTAPYEFRSTPGGFGCEDPRVTFIAALDHYVMAYTAFGPDGPRIALALSRDAYSWERLGLMDFSARGLPCGDDKDAAFYPEPVHSPSGVLSFAFYHRPMLHLSALDGYAAVPKILRLPPQDREGVRIGYVPLEPVMQDRRNLLRVAESILVLPPANEWGRIKTGGGTPPLRIAEGWFSLYHAVDVELDGDDPRKLRYAAGLVVHDLERPDIIRYRSPQPLIVPTTPEERHGTVSDVVFPTGIDRSTADPRRFDFYYGMADARVGRARLELGASSLAQPEESAA